MHILSILLMTVEVVVCLMLIGLVLIQRNKGEGISSAIGGGMGEAIFGAQVGNVVTRTTVVLGIVFLLNTICLTLLLTRSQGHSSGSVMDGVAKPPAAREAPGLPGGAGAPAPVLPSTPAAPVAPAAPGNTAP
jgi:preprotein translocase subunit SecG